MTRAARAALALAFGAAIAQPALAQKQGGTLRIYHRDNLPRALSRRPRLPRGASSRQMGSSQSRSFSRASATADEIAWSNFSPFSGLAAPASPMTPISERLDNCRHR